MKIFALLLLMVIILVVVIFVAPIYLSLKGVLAISDYLSILSVVVSWPAAALLIATFFFARFHGSIESLLKNVGSMKFPGGFEYQAQDPNLPIKTNDTKVKEVVEASNDDKLKEMKESLSEISPNEALSNTDINLINKQQSELIDAVRYWKYSYYNQYFVQRTKDVLIWFANSASQTRPSYDMIWSPYIIDSNQRNIIVTVLLNNGMLKEENGLIRITEEGRAFLQFFSYIPKAA